MGKAIPEEMMRTPGIRRSSPVFLTTENTSSAARRFASTGSNSSWARSGANIWAILIILHSEVISYQPSVISQVNLT